MEDLIQSLSDSAKSSVSVLPEEGGREADSENAPTAAVSDDEDEVFHPWEGEDAPEVAGEPTAEAEEDDEFEWDEPPDADTPLTFDPEPDLDDPVVVKHMAALAQQNDGGLEQELPSVSNVIHADIQQAPLATMQSSQSKPGKPTPRKPTPVESPQDVEAAIRAQLTQMKKPAVPPVKENTPEKTGLFAKLAKTQVAEPPAPTPPKPVPSNPLKEALMNIDDGPSPSSVKRKGFMLVMVLFLIALVTYLFGEMLVGVVPALEPLIGGFISLVDGLREATQNLFGG